MLARSLLGLMRELSRIRLGLPPSMLALSKDSGSDSRLPPHNDEGARARTEASVSNERRRRLLLDEANVKIEALSVNRLLAVAVLYVCGWGDDVCCTKCAGMADAGDGVVKGCVNWMVLPVCVEGCACVLVLALTAIDCMVVSVVVSDRTDGAGDENVLSPPFLYSIPPLAVLLVPATDDAMLEGAPPE
jgi:hypothetical protein